MMEPEYDFDDDDLINDDMEDGFDEHPPEEEFPDDYEMFEAKTAAAPTQKPSSQPIQPSSQQQQQLSPTKPPPPPPAPNATTPPLQSAPLSEIHVQSLPKRSADLYSFERFKKGNNNGWRSTKNKEAFEVKEWKRTKTVSPNNNNNNKSNKAKNNNQPLLERNKQLEQITLDLKKKKSGGGGGVSRMPIAGKNSISMTLAGGTRLHVVQNNNNNNKTHAVAAEQRVSSPRKKSSHHHLLGVSMTTLMARSDTLMMQAKQQQRSKKSSSSVFSSGDTQLWVDKHAPTTFSHLLSDDQTNRNVLRALRSWDPYVFGREAPKSRFPKDEETTTTTTNNSNDIRPIASRRVLLLSGPPGVGKTTLAHIVAKHAGYQPLEVNASDDRSSKVLQETVIRAMESSTMTNDLKLGGKPNCVILDEVDGADAKSAISALVKIIRADIPEKGKGGSTYLRRPLIFICNHKYAPALRPLLPYCQHFDVEPPADARLVSRLTAILARERLVTPSLYLNQLVVGTGGDIRSSLFTLQFAAAKARSKAAALDSRGLVDVTATLRAALNGDGIKDARTDLASTVTTIFKKPKNKKGAEGSTHKVLTAIESFGDNDKAMSCLFTNLLQVSYVDPTMERCGLAHEWLSGGAIGNRTSAFAVMGAVHLLCRVETRSELTVSNRDSSNAHYQREAHRGILQKFVEGLRQPSYDNAITETVPYALWMLSGGGGGLNRPVSSIDILSKKEMVAFDAHVSCLRSLSLTYVAEEQSNDRFGNKYQQQQQQQQQNYSPEVEMRLEPEIHRLVYFKGYRPPPQNRRKRVPSVLRELLAHKARLETISERETAAKAASSPTKKKTSSKHWNQPNKAKVTKETAADPEPVVVEPEKSKKQKAADSTTTTIGPPVKKQKVAKNFLGIGALKAKAAKSARKKALVGFTRTKTEKMAHTGSGLPLKQVIRFKYQKGFTQAVRTPCRLEDLM